MNNYQGIGILGGSFNPVHMGHLRLGIEVFEHFYPGLKYIDLVPCAHPPHKDISGILPFNMRVEMLKEAISNVAYFKINTSESLRKGPSYTYDTLIEYHTKFSHSELFFILGEKDFLTINSWYNGLSIPELTNLIVVAQINHNIIDFKNNVLSFWPKAKCDVENHMTIFSLGKTNIFYIAFPHLEINASLIRERWVQGKSIKYFTPSKVVDFLEAHEKIAKQSWIKV